MVKGKDQQQDDDQHSVTLCLQNYGKNLHSTIQIWDQNLRKMN